MKSLHSSITLSIIIITVAAVVQAASPLQPAEKDILTVCPQDTKCTIQDHNDRQYMIVWSGEPETIPPELRRTPTLSHEEGSFYFERVAEKGENVFIISPAGISFPVIFAVPNIQAGEILLLEQPIKSDGEYWYAEKNRGAETPDTYLFYVKTPSGEKFYLNANSGDTYYVIKPMTAAEPIANYLFTVTTASSSTDAPSPSTDDQ